MIKKLLSLYAQEWNWFRKRVLKVFVITFLVFLAASVAYYCYYANHPEKTLSKYHEIQKNIPLRTATGWKLALSLFIHNTKVTFFDIALGLIPVLFLPLLKMMTMCSFLGIMSAWAHVNGQNILNQVALHTLPHGFIELPAAVYSYSLGIVMCFKISKKLLAPFNPFPWKAKQSPLFGEKRKESEPLSSFIFHCFKNLLLIIVPLVFIAALIEAFITALHFT
jgi:uncharacterized membrane protein SpoIIM required for sporulation